ncbi:type IV pilus biogenesis protein PilP [Yersinia similis]|uniref:type IV pilus biogenesis protein PilP n=1 Tax=Yersinia similis TaxID=367190 RepID=UPI00061C1FC9|nr:type IV pilus biogenesis protein PilP [Yersinia similis]CNB80730.1 putative type IV pilus protein [Yersinia similis]
MLNKYSHPLLLCILFGPTPGSYAALTTALPDVTHTTEIQKSSPTESETPSSDTPPTPTRLHENSGNTLNLARLERIQADTLLFEAQAARAKALLSLQQNNGYDASLPAPLSQSLVAPVTATGGIPGTTLSTLPTQTALPRIVEIAGSGKHLRTRLALSDGAAVELSAGQRIPGTNNTVKTITAQEVQITTSTGETHTLAFTE